MRFYSAIAAIFCLFTVSISFAEPNCQFFVNGKQTDLVKRKHLDTFYYGDSLPTLNRYVSVVLPSGINNEISISYSDNDLGTLTSIEGAFDASGTFHSAFHSKEGTDLFQIHCSK